MADKNMVVSNDKDEVNSDNCWNLGPSCITDNTQTPLSLTARPYQAYSLMNISRLQQHSHHNYCSSPLIIRYPSIELQLLFFILSNGSFKKWHTVGSLLTVSQQRLQGKRALPLCQTWQHRSERPTFPSPTHSHSSRLHAAKGGEIMDATMNIVASIDEH